MAQAPFQRTARRDVEEHQLLVDAEKNIERRAFLELLWHVGAAQFDLVNLKAEDVDWNSRTISYNRQKTGRLCTLRFGDEVAEILKRAAHQRAAVSEVFDAFVR